MANKLIPLDSRLSIPLFPIRRPVILNVSLAWQPLRRFLLHHASDRIIDCSMNPHTIAAQSAYSEIAVIATMAFLQG